MDGQTISQNQKRTQKEYSLPFKLQVILEVEKGDLLIEKLKGSMVFKAATAG